MPAAYLDKLNPEQRRAVEHGIGENQCVPGRPLLVIAGAGFGKTNTLAHRVAHLIVNGVEPRRILLMTFSRRAATEMGAHLLPCTWCGGGDHDRCARLGGYIPCHRSAIAARICGANRTG